jgi:hypothetical protein
METTQMKFRKKPIVIEAMQWTGNNAQAIGAFASSSTRGFRIEKHGIIISTLEGEMTANVGDWIIKGVVGEFYPCKPGIFKAIYEPVNSSESEGIEAPQSNPGDSHQIREPDWIEWKGGMCPLPYDALVEIKYGDDKILRDVKAGHVGWLWGDGNRNFNVVAYRVWPLMSAVVPELLGLIEELLQSDAAPGFALKHTLWGKHARAVIAKAKEGAQ